MIPTRTRCKLPAALSYPVGAAALSDALAGAPQAAALTIDFRDRPVHRASEFRRLLRDRRPYPVLVAEYRPATEPGYTGSAVAAARGL